MDPQQMSAERPGELHERITPLLVSQAGSHERSSHPDHGLLEARRTADTTRIARIVDEWGVDLAHSPYADLVYDAATTLPLELARDLPGLAFRFEDIGRLPVGTTPISLPATLEDARAEVARNGDLRLRQALLPLTTRRRLGRFDEALAIVRAAEPLAAASVYPLYGDKSRVLPYWYLQAGVTAQHGGDLDVARRYFLEAWTHRAREPYGFVGRGIAGHLALLDAFCGDDAASTMWSDRAQAEGRRADLWVDRFSASNLAGAAAIRAVDALDHRAERSLRAVSHPSQHPGQWPVVLWLHVQHALTFGDIARARQYVETTLAARPTGPARAGLAAGLIPLIQGQLHLAMGQGQQALAAIAGAPDVGGLASVLRARTLLLTGEVAAALTLIEELTRDGATAPRALTESLLVAAVAHVAAGNHATAVAAARRATARVCEQSSPQVLATVPRSSLTELVPGVPGLGPLLARLDERGIGDMYPESVDLISLTDRERTLLRDLDTDRTLAEIGEAHFVSVNTIRTHVANLRRKLGARSRHEVLTRARQLGLADDED